MFPQEFREARLHPPPSGFYSTRESDTYLGGLDQHKHVALLSLLPLQGFHPSLQMAQSSLRLPSYGYVRSASTRYDPLQGLSSKRGWLISLKTADPPGVSHLLILHSCSIPAHIWSRLLKARGASPSPCQPLFEMLLSSTGAKL